MDTPLGIGMLGCGTVGSGVVKLLRDHPRRLAERANRPLHLRRILVREPGKDRGLDLPKELLTTDLDQVLRDPEIQVVAELVGGIDWAKKAVLAALAAGKDVVTANKALLAMHGGEVFDAARRHGRSVAFEASVAGGVPIVAALAQSLAANQIQSLQGILNGTCNFILTKMTEDEVDYGVALAEAQQRGFAEADPTMDVDGTDAAHKLAILAQIAFGATVPVSAIDRRGIAGLDPEDIRFARELGYVIKLLAEAWYTKGQLALHVSPVLLRRNAPLALVRGAYNAIAVVGDAVGDTLYYGQGAGSLPTASAVVADLIDVAVGRAERTFQTLRLWSGREAVRLQTAESVRTRFYLRILVEDRPGVLAEVTRVLADHQISIASMIQHEAPEEHEGEKVQLVIMTHTAGTGAFRTAVADLDRLSCVLPPTVYYPVGD